MKKFNSIISIVVLYALAAMVMPFTLAAQTIGSAAADESCGSAVLLINKNYFTIVTKAIDDAREEIFISIFSFKTGVHENSYPDRLLAHLEKAVQRGVKVRVILEASGKKEDGLDAQNQQTKKMLEERGVEVYLDSANTTTHTKLIVIDGRFVILGSHNFTQSALKYNNEISVLLDRRDLASQARNYMLKIIRGAK